MGFLSCHFWNVYGFNSRRWLLRLCTCPTLASWRSAGQVRYLGRILKTGITHAGTCSRSLMSLTVNSPEVYFFMLPCLAVPESPPVNNGGRCIPVHVSLSITQRRFCDTQITKGSRPGTPYNCPGIAGLGAVQSKNRMRPA